jgi:hypothetical protein
MEDVVPAKLDPKWTKLDCSRNVGDREVELSTQLFSFEQNGMAITINVEV